MPSVHELSQFLTWMLFFSILICQRYHGVSSCAPADRSALASFSNSLNTAIDAWPRDAENSSVDCCRWPGVRCRRFGASEPQVVLLDLAGRGLTGGLPSSLARLEKLIRLNLSWNSLQGPIPTELLLRMPQLRVLDLSHNSLTGELVGVAPAALGAGASKLSHLDVSFNGLTRLCTGVFFGLPRLRTFSAESNLLTGVMPYSLSSCSELEYLNMANNSLHGTLAALNFTHLTRLGAVHLGWNRLRGSIPASLSCCRDLRVVNLRRNELSGTVPSTFRRLRALSFLDIGNNSITGIAQALRALQECRALAILILTMNFQGEEMPSGIRGFPRVRLLGVANCALRGSVPRWLRASTQLRVLDLSWNRLTGQIPPWIGSFDTLFRLDLSSNALTGEIPVALTRLKSLTACAGNASEVQQLSLSDYGVRLYNWHVERGDLWYNRYIPPSLDLSQNGLAGTIPPELGNLRMLNLLNLSFNSLSGPIPGTLASLRTLQTLGLSYNELTGEIPASLTGLTFLSCFDVSHNRLRGVIPNLNQFTTFPCSSFAGNPGLHGDYCDGVAAGVAVPWADGLILPEGDDIFGLPFWLGVVVGLLVTMFVAARRTVEGSAG